VHIRSAALWALALSGMSAAAFAFPMRYFRGWRWEHVWIGQALTSNLVLPMATLLLMWPMFRPHLAVVPAERYLEIVLLGMTWGVGGIGYGLSLVLLGLSFTYSVLFSVTTICGAVLPMWIGVRTRPAHLVPFLLGLGLCVFGTLAVAIAAAWRSRERVDLSGQIGSLSMPVPRIPYLAALGLALAAGACSSAMGLALVLNESLVNGLLKSGISAGIAPLIVWVPLDIGSGIIALAYGLWCARRSSSLHSFYRRSPWWNWSLVFLMGALGFGALLLYGLGSSTDGHPSKNVAWATYMTFFILSGNAIGLLSREWMNCSRRTMLLLLTGIGLLLGAIGSLGLA